jgi:hypothetical protein
MEVTLNNLRFPTNREARGRTLFTNGIWARDRYSNPSNLLLSFALMGWRNRYLCVLGAIVVFSAVLMLRVRPTVAVGGPSSASAPSVPGPSFGSAPVAQGVPSHFDGFSHGLRTTNLPPALRAVRASEGAHHPSAGAAGPVYGPLHRRPPPSFT